MRTSLNQTQFPPNFLNSHTKTTNFKISLFIIAIIFSSYTISAQYKTIRPGQYTSSNTWVGGSVPPSGADVIISHDVTLTSASATAGEITLSNGGTLTVDVTGGLMAAEAIVINGGSLINSGGTINIGSSGGGKQFLKLNSGLVSLNKGIFNVNGNIIMLDGNFNMSGGNLNIDPNSGSASKSVADNTNIFSLSSAVKTSVTGGNITFVDPPFGGNGASFAFTGNSGNADWSGNTMIFGGNTGRNANAGSPLGFNIDTKASGANGSYIKLGDVIINGGSGTNRLVTGSKDDDNGFDIGGDLTINPNSEVRTLAGGSVLRIQGNIYNKGKFIDLAGIAFSGRSGPNTVAQLVTNFDKKGLFLNNANLRAANAHFTGLTFNNIAKPIAVTFDNGDGKVVDGAVGISKRVDFTNGVIDIGALNQFVLRKTCAVTRVNGFLLRGGGGQMVREFPKGASSFTYHISDTEGNFDYTPVTITLTSNNYEARVFTINQKDVVHPNMNSGGRPSDYLSRYWQIVCTSPGTFTGNITFNYLSEDINGSENEIQLSNWDGSKWYENNSGANRNKVSIAINQNTWPRNRICQVTGRKESNNNSRVASTTSVAPATEIKVAEPVNKVTIYPNPVSDGNINLRFNENGDKKYNVSVYNNVGQKVFGGYVTNGGGKSTQTIQLPSNSAEGLYRVVLNSEKDQVLLNNVLVKK